MSSEIASVGVVWRGDPTDPDPELSETRLARVFEVLASRGLTAVPVVYDDVAVEQARRRLLSLDAALVWIDPIFNGARREVLDAMLRDVAAQGVWVSAHPDVIMRMGTKEVLHRTRTMSWGCDTALYRTAEAMRTELPARLAVGPRVIKRNRGNGGQGVWKVEAMASPRNRPRVRV